MKDINIKFSPTFRDLYKKIYHKNFDEVYYEGELMDYLDMGRNIHGVVRIESDVDIYIQKNIVGENDYLVVGIEQI